MDNIELQIFFQILVPGLFVTFCQCQRLWPKVAGNKNKIFLVLYAFLYGIENLCSIAVFNMLKFDNAEAIISLMILSTPILSLVILR